MSADQFVERSIDGLLFAMLMLVACQILGLAIAFIWAWWENRNHPLNRLVRAIRYYEDMLHTARDLGMPTAEIEHLYHVELKSLFAHWK